MSLYAGILILVQSLAPFAAGNDKDYYALQAEEFFELEEVQAPVNPDKPDLRLLEAAVFFASNEARTDYQKPVFKHDTTLREAAAFQAGYLKTTGRLDHSNRQRGMRSISDRISHFGGNFAAVAENLTRIHLLELGKDNTYFLNAEGKAVNEAGHPLRKLSYAEAGRKAVKNWLHSKGHRANLLGGYSHLGIGASEIVWTTDGIPQVYLVQNFGNNKL